MERIRHNTSKSKLLLIFILGALVAAALILGVRYYSLISNTTHYHATFAVFVNGQRQEFEEAGFYEEVVSCTLAEENPAARVHMHRPDNDIVHVHDDQVTWGNFFENIGFSISDRHLKTNSQLYVGRDSSPVVFWLNGQPVRSPANRVIENEDVLMVSYGTANEPALRQQYEATSNDEAAAANQQDDPGSCGGNVRDWRHILRELF